MSSPIFAPSPEGSPRVGMPPLYSVSPPPPIAGPKGGENILTPATHATMLSSRRWPADEARPVLSTSTPTKKGESSQIDNGNGSKSEILGLDMSGFRIKTLTPAICRFTFLTELRLSNNFISILPTGFGQLRNLAFLDLSNNQLSELPAEFGWLSCLKELLLFNNNIHDFPSEMGYLYQLENFGIEGNPISESLMQIVHSQGSTGIIPFLRDHAINTLPPGERTWHAVDSYSSNSKASVSLLCYNVLCDKYATTQMFGYVPSWFLSWDYRKQLIMHEILSYDADVVCLQEVESNQFEQYFKPQLRMRGGYDGVFSPKSRSRTMGEWDRAFVDGCATFFKADKFKFEDKTLIEFNQLALARPSLRKHKDMYNRVMTRDNISVVIRLEHKESRHELIIGNVHIHWDPSFRDVKLVQAIMLAEELEKISVLHPKASVILCGDFNSLPGSGVCTFLETGSIPADHPDFMTHTYEPYTTEGAKHSLNLRNAHAFAADQLSFTNFTPMFLGVIDYVLYRAGGLSVTGTLGSISGDYLKQLVGLPSQHLPSDHISLLVEFKVESSQQSHQPSSFSNKKEVTRYSTASGSDPSVPKRLYSRNKNALT